MPCEGDTPAAPAAVDASRLRQCLFTLAELLYVNGHVLETVTLPQCGLARRDTAVLDEQNVGWAACREMLESNAAGMTNQEGRFVLTALGRDIMFDLFGQGAADCA
ncbi:hypothetical protein [Halomonas sp. GD1P12]|uniref:hypothetical protein n=1 Tax=Halomonas sp. GD1P12 TaxID=2982691 RepID=UPI0021E4812E|nr:hypothetical protein [Halomonas sp. GD1P12]UYG00420.1 hypothetical protein OCT39_02365 [Halomonas sp. GD1P12]